MIKIMYKQKNDDIVDIYNGFDDELIDEIDCNYIDDYADIIIPENDKFDIIIKKYDNDEYDEIYQIDFVNDIDDCNIIIKQTDDEIIINDEKFDCIFAAEDHLFKKYNIDLFVVSFISSMIEKMNKYIKIKIEN